MKYDAFISYSHAADGKMAPALQIALERFAKPWYKIRNLNIFRDESTLSASPHLWDNIVKALNNSDYLIYMASPQAAQSKWVNQEIEHWLTHKSLETLIIVLTEGDVAWDNRTNTFKESSTLAIPNALKASFTSEPFYIDLRNAKDEADVSLRNPIFKKEVLKLAAHIHGESPKNMAGEEVKAHKRMIRVRNSAIAVLIALLGFSLYQTNEANIQRDDAELQKSIAEDERKKAIDSSKEAQKQRDHAKAQTAFALAESQRANDSAAVAKSQRDIAKREKEIATRERDRAQANLLTFQAQTEPNPTKAFLYAKEALKYDKNDLSIAQAYNVYANNHISKSILINGDLGYQQYISFLPNDDTRFITYGHISGINTEFEQNWDNMGIWYTSDGKKQKTEGEKFRLWSMNGDLLKEVTEAEAKTLLKQPDLDIFELAKSKEYLVNFSQLHDNRSASDLVIYDRSTGEEVFTIVIKGSDTSITDAWVTTDNKNVMAIGVDGILRIWDFKTRFKSTYYLGENNFEFYGTDLGLTFSSDKSQLLVSITHEFVVFDLKNKGLYNSRTIKDIDCTRFRDDNSVLVKTSNGFYIWHIDSDQFIPTTESFKCSWDDDSKNGYSICGDFSEMICQEVDNEIGYEMILAADDNQELQSFALFPSEDYIITGGLEIFKNPSFDRKTFTWSKPLKMINSDLKGNVSFKIPKSEAYILAWKIDFSAETERYEFEIFDVASGQIIMKFPPYIIGEGNLFANMDMSPDEKKILITYGDTLTIWNTPKTLDEFLKSGFTNDLLPVEKARTPRYVRY